MAPRSSGPNCLLFFFFSACTRLLFADAVSLFSPLHQTSSHQPPSSIEVRGLIGFAFCFSFCDGCLLVSLSRVRVCVCVSSYSSLYFLRFLSLLAGQRLLSPLCLTFFCPCVLPSFRFFFSPFPPRLSKPPLFAGRLRKRRYGKKEKGDTHAKDHHQDQEQLCEYLENTEKAKCGSRPIIPLLFSRTPAVRPKTRTPAHPQTHPRTHTNVPPSFFLLPSSATSFFFLCSTLSPVPPFHSFVLPQRCATVGPPPPASSLPRRVSPPPVLSPPFS